VRGALQTRIKALSKAKRHRDIYAIRRVCEEGISFVREQTGTGVPSLWNVERFLIKNLIDVEWLVNNYRGLITQVETHLREKNRQVPLSFVYKYGYSLVSSGDFETCKLLVARGKNSSVACTSETYNSVLLVEACMFYESGDYQRSLATLNGITCESLRISMQARYYIYCMLVRQTLGDFDKHEHYMKLAQMTSKQANKNEYLLRINYNVAMFMLNQARHSEIKHLIRQSIRLANQQRLYRSLCTMYFVASAVYHEEGNQSQALKYLDKAIRLATDIGMEEHVNAYTARFALIYRSLGQYGTAMHYLEVVRRRSSPGDRHHFFASVILLDVYTTINSRLAKRCMKELSKLSSKRTTDQALGLYHQFLGDYKRMAGKYDAALSDYSAALEIYEAVHDEDDAIRTRIAMGHGYLGLGEPRKTASLIDELAKLVDGLQSRKIGTEYEMMKLSYRLHDRLGSEGLNQALAICESQRDSIREMNLRIGMDALLFQVYTELGDRKNAIRCFNQYYSSVKELCGSLPDPKMVSDYLAGQEFVGLVAKFKSL
jgi:tetratricopeptide (TPR) repeat protein